MNGWPCVTASEGERGTESIHKNARNLCHTLNTISPVRGFDLQEINTFPRNRKNKNTVCRVNKIMAPPMLLKSLVD